MEGRRAGPRGRERARVGRGRGPRRSQGRSPPRPHAPLADARLAPQLQGVAVLPAQVSRPGFRGDTPAGPRGAARRGRDTFAGGRCAAPRAAGYLCVCGGPKRTCVGPRPISRPGCTTLAGCGSRKPRQGPPISTSTLNRRRPPGLRPCFWASSSREPSLTEGGGKPYVPGGRWSLFVGNRAAPVTLQTFRVVA